MRRPPLLALVLCAAAAAVLAAPALAAKDELELVSRATGPAGAPADADFMSSSISADGRFVAFSSGEDNLSAEDQNGVTNVFVRDLLSATTTLVSRASGAAGVAANQGSSDPSISADGRLVAFESDADNLSGDDTNGFTDVFVRDLVAGTTTLVSRATGAAGAPGAGARSTDPSISGGGRFVAFESDANNLSADDDNGVQNIFVRDLLANTTSLVSRAPGPGGAGANDDSFGPSISANGNRVAFDTLANNLSNEDDNAVRNVVVRDLTAATNALVSRASGVAGAPGDADSTSADLSPSGRYVAFLSSADNMSTEDVNAFSNTFENGATWLSADRGFARFTGLRWRHPLD